MKNRTPCKVCGHEMIVQIHHTNNCDNCRQYDLFQSGAGWYHEYLEINGLTLLFRSEDQLLILTRSRFINNGPRTVIMEQECEKFTPELAKKWIAKMKVLAILS